MGDVIKFPVHIPYKCSSECDGCCICNGGLFLCVNCNCAEGSLPTHCPQQKVDSDTQDKIMDGTLDYYKGKWVDYGES